jgi:hypothetical protein
VRRLIFILIFITVPFRSVTQESVNTENAVLLSRTTCCHDTAWVEAETAMAEELRLLNIPVTTISVQAEGETDLPEALIRETRYMNAAVAVSVLRISGPTARVEVWIYDRITDKTLVKSWTLADQNDPDAAMVAGIRAVEALRASLLEIRMHPALTVSSQQEQKPLSDLAKSTKLYGGKEPEDQQPHNQLVSDEIKRVAVGAGPSLLASFQGAGVRGGFDIAFDWQPFRFAALHFDTAYWPMGEDIEKDGAVSALKLLLVRGGLTFVISDKRIVRPSVSILGGGFMAFAEGLKAKEDQTPVSDINKVGYIGGAFDTAFRISHWFFLRLNIGVGVTLPEVVLHHGDVEAASIGRPLLDASLRAEVRLP